MWRPRLIVLQPTPYCNIDCDYCYLRHRDSRGLMAPAVVEAIRDTILARLAPDAAPRIVWHAGEPTTAPIAWYRHAYETLRPVVPAGTTFAIQTNGVGLSEAWIDFLGQSATQVGLSIDGPQRFHDARRKTRAGGPTWSLAMRSLHRLQADGIDPTVITVLHRASLSAADEYFRFYRKHAVHHVSFSIDEVNGANRTSSFDGSDRKPVMVAFLRDLLGHAFADGYPLHIRDIERVGRLLSGSELTDNEQVTPWDVVAVAANGDVTTFSPDFMELNSAAHSDFCFGNVLRDRLEDLMENPQVRRTAHEISLGVDRCRRDCPYFGLCGGGSPSNKMAETGSLAAGETQFCRLSVQASADALLQFLQATAATGGDRCERHLPIHASDAGGRRPQAG